MSENDVEFRALLWDKFKEVCCRRDIKKDTCELGRLCAGSNCNNWQKLLEIESGYKALNYEILLEMCAYSGMSKKGGRVCMLEKVGESFVNDSCSKKECRVWSELKELVREIIED